MSPPAATVMGVLRYVAPKPASKLPTVVNPSDQRRAGPKVGWRKQGQTKTIQHHISVAGLFLVFCFLASSLNKVEMPAGVARLDT